MDRKELINQRIEKMENKKIIYKDFLLIILAIRIINNSNKI